MKGDRKRPPRSGIGFLWRQLARNRGAVAGLFVLIGMALMAVLAPWIRPYDPLKVDYEIIMRPPCLAHPMGTDWLGRDVLSRVIVGSRLSLGVGFIAIGIALSAGAVLGLLAGFFLRLDNLIMRFVDILLAFPDLLLSITIVATLGPGLQNVMIAVGIGSIPGYARVIRGGVLSLREQDFVQAAQAIGATPARVLARHVVPNLLAPVIVLTTFRLAGAVLAASALSFLGLGAQPPDPEWGLLINEGRKYVMQAPWLVLCPGAVISLVVLAFNLFGDGLRDALDPRLKQ